MVKYMVATLIFSDASSTLFSVYVIFGAQVGISNQTILACAIVNRWIGLAGGFLWYFLCRVIGARMCYLVAMVLTLVAAVMCSMVRTDLHYQVMNIVLAVAGAGWYIFSRVLLARLTTRANTAQHFGFMAGVSRVSGMIGPVVYGGVVLLAGARAGLVSLAVLAAPALVLMANVDFEVGKQCAESVPIPEAGDDP